MDLNTRIANAIYDKELAAVTDSILADHSKNLNVEDSRRLRKANAVCSNIWDMCIREGRSICEQFEAAGIETSFDTGTEKSHRPQIHQFNISIKDKDPTNAVAIAARMGYRSSISTSSAEWELFRRAHSHMTLTKTDDVSMRMVLQWFIEQQKSSLERLFWPNLQDTRLIPLPAAS